MKRVLLFTSIALLGLVGLVIAFITFCLKLQQVFYLNPNFRLSSVEEMPCLLVAMK